MEQDQWERAQVLAAAARGAIREPAWDAWVERVWVLAGTACARVVAGVLPISALYHVTSLNVQPVVQK